MTALYEAVPTNKGHLYGNEEGTSQASTDQKGYEDRALTDSQQAMLTMVKIAPYLTKNEKARFSKAVVEKTFEKNQIPFPSLDGFNVKSYKPVSFVPAEGSAHSAMYDVKKKKWLEFDAEALQVSEMLDILTYATQRGLLNSRTWVKDVFHTKANWKFFLSELSEYEMYFRIRDPWWFALAILAEHESFEEGFSTAEEMAEKLLEHSVDTGQFKLLA